MFLNIAALASSAGILGYCIFAGDGATEKGYAEEAEAPFPAEDMETESAPALLRIASNPENAKVFIDGYYKGRTPCEVEVSSAGKKGFHFLTLIKPGYEKVEKRIELIEAREEDLSINLTEE